MRKSPTINPRTCETCGIEYLPTGTAQRFCKDCAALRTVATKRAYFLRKFPNSKPKVKRDDPCCICGKPFSSSFEGKPYCNLHYLRMKAHGDVDLHPRAGTNTYRVDDDVATVITKNGMTFTVDAADLPIVSRYSWSFGSRPYPVANIHGKVTPVHRYLLSPPPGAVVDHINGNPTDNRRCNLRICTPKANSRNTSVSKNCKSGHLGIRITHSHHYEARICVDGKTISLGTYDTLEDAIAARHDGEIRYFGEYAPSLSRS